MRTWEIDWRIDSLRRVMAAIQSGLSQVQSRMSDEPPFDADWALESSDTLLGVAFVGAQAYIEGTIGDVWRVQLGRGHAGKKATKKLKRECLKHDVTLASGRVTRVELINAAANYYKHHSGAGGSWSDTVDVLGKVGIAETTEYPCARAADSLCGKEWHLRDLCDIVSEWRANVLGTLGHAGPSSARQSRRIYVRADSNAGVAPARKPR